MRLPIRTPALALALAFATFGASAAPHRLRSSSSSGPVAAEASSRRAPPGAGQTPTPGQGVEGARAERPGYKLSAEEDAFLEELSKRAFLYFWEQADPALGLVRERARLDDSASASPDPQRAVGSIAATGFGLTALCIAAERDWRPRVLLVERARATLMFLAERQVHKNGWFYQRVNLRTGRREGRSEISSIAMAELLAGLLTARQCFADDPGIVRAAEAIYRRVDFPWMLNGHATLLARGWTPESEFREQRWDEAGEAMLLYILGAGSPKRPLPRPAESWAAWSRPQVVYEGLSYVQSAAPLSGHQYAQAWIPFQDWRDPVPPQPDWFENAAVATRAQQRFFQSLSAEFPGYSAHIWGLTSSDSRTGYRTWGGPPRDPALDGTVAPSAAAGSLMIAPAIALPALREMQARFGERIYGRYGFADAFQPTANWVSTDVIGVDLGITLLSAENLRGGRVWRWFMANEEVVSGLKQAGLTLTPRVD